MAANKTLAATTRTGTGKGAARSVRRENRVPAVIYGGGEAAQPISLDYKTINQLIYAGHFLTTIFDIDLGDGKVERVIPRDYQLDVVRDTPLHVDFLRLKPGSTLRINVPVHVVGAEVSPGVKIGGTLNVVLHTIELRVPADNIPEAITADVSAMGVNESLHISAIKLPEGCKPIIQDRDFTVVTIAPPAKVEEAPAPAAAPAKGKK
jgi:large subunit ribosomal protein L25